MKKSALSIAAFSIAAELAEAKSKKKKLTGIQLYSVRDDMTKDPLATLKALAAQGYKHVEHAWYIDRKFYGWSASEFRKVLDDLGLQMPSGHTVLSLPQHWNETTKDFTDKWKWTVEDAAVVGQQFVISPSMSNDVRKSKDSLLKLMDIFNKSGELCKKNGGMKFGYHNHDFEFAEQLDGESLYDIILKNTDKNLVIHQLDIGNLYNGGAKADDIMKKWAGRFSSMHVKDEIKSTGADSHERYESTILGTGIVPVKDVVDMGKKTGTIHFIIEQESYQGKTPLDCAKQDLEIMKKWGY
ncbi:MAG: TIM barrel protein [Bacteroidota bacterium]